MLRKKSVFEKKQTNSCTLVQFDSYGFIYIGGY